MRAFVIGSTAVILFWNPPINDPSPVTGYQVTYTNGQVTVTRFTGADVRNLFIPGLEQGVTYLFSVAALNEAGSSNFESISLTIPGKNYVIIMCTLSFI